MTVVGHFRSILPAGLLVAGLLAGCGGQSGSSGTGAAGPSQLASSPGGAGTGQHGGSSFSKASGGGSNPSGVGGSPSGVGGSKSSGGKPSNKSGGGSGGGGGGQPTPDGPETNNQADFGVAFSCFPGGDPSDCGQIEHFGSGDVAIGRTHTTAITLANVTSAVTLASLAISGASADEYSLDPGTCTPGAEVSRAIPGDTTTPAAAAQTCTLRVTFTPASEGIQRATLVIATDDAARGMTIGLRGTGGPAAIAAAATGN